MMVISSRIRAFVDDDLADVLLYGHLVSRCSASGASSPPAITSVCPVPLQNRQTQSPPLNVEYASGLFIPRCLFFCGCGRRPRLFISPVCFCCFLISVFSPPVSVYSVSVVKAFPSIPGQETRQAFYRSPVTFPARRTIMWLLCPAFHPPAFGIPHCGRWNDRPQNPHHCAFAPQAPRRGDVAAQKELFRSLKRFTVLSGDPSELFPVNRFKLAPQILF
jgi:hypothetical protein